MRKLSEILDAALKSDGLDFYRNLVPECIPANLKQSFELRAYQNEAFGRFVFYWEQYANRPKNELAQILFQMATGSGKTLIMAGLILYLYSKSYRNFLFFVNSANIIEKTKENFLNPQSSKYLFADTVSFNGRQVQIRQVENFQTAGADDINICFSTVQGLHSLLNTPRENALTYNDFENQKIVLISDEAHHINAETKAGAKRVPSAVGSAISEADNETNTWENTIMRIFNAHNDNVMIEFTATADLSNSEIAAKYEDKLIFDYPLRQFRIDGYSKEVHVLQADIEPLQRAFQAILLSQYRRKIFEKYGLKIKPVILMKSKTIKESQTFAEQFVEQVKNLNVDFLEKIKAASVGTPVEKMFDYCAANGISPENLIAELQEDFREDKLISVNSREESEEKQIAVNTLEDTNNEYRVIFAVDKLNEGWDVLNLFDIVRLYNTRDSGGGKIGKTTMQEAQLIGRGARYCPFQTDDAQPLFKRKFDDATDSELRICEELYYHSSHNPKYIQELNTALIEIGIKAPKTVLHKENEEEQLQGNSLLFKDKNQENVFSFKNAIIEQTHEVKLKTGCSSTTQMFSDNTSISRNKEFTNRILKLVDLGEHIIRKAMQKIDFYNFDKLQNCLPDLQSTSEFIASENYLGKVKIKVFGASSQLENLSSEQKLAVATEALNKIAVTIISSRFHP